MVSQSEFYTYLQGLVQSLAFKWDYFNAREATLKLWVKHNSGIIMSTMASLITGLLILNLLNRLIRRRSKKTSKLRVTGLCEGNPSGDSHHKGPVTQKMFPFGDVIMKPTNLLMTGTCNTITQKSRQRIRGTYFVDYTTDAYMCVMVFELNYCHLGDLNEDLNQ